METVQLAVGDCLIFSEKLFHATVPYTGLGERRTLFYKYLPFGAMREDVEPKFYDLTDPAMSDEQRMVLGWPQEWPPAAADPKL